MSGPAEGDLILLSAGTAARRAAGRGRAEQLVAAVEWRRLGELLRARRLLPTLGPRILELAGDHVSEQFQSEVANAVAAGRRQGALLQLIAARVIDALARAGIRASALKGPMLGEAIYGDLGRRPSVDIDLLVAPEQLHEAVTIVRDMGYAAPGDRVGAEGLPLLHFALVHQREELPPVELHWRVHWYESRFARERLLAPSVELSGAWKAAPIDELTALLLFYARDGFIGLRHATDIGAWWDAFGARVPDGALTESIAAYPVLDRVLSVAARVAERTVGVPASRLLARRTRLSTRSRIALRLAAPYPHSSQAQIYADMGLIDGLLTPPGGLREFCRRQVAPSRERIGELTPLARGPWAHSTVGYSVRVLSRYGLALTRLLRARENL